MNFNLQNLFGLLAKPEVLVDPASFNDPLALKTSWEPAKSGGANFRTHEAVQIQANRIEFKPTTMMLILPWLFVVIPLIGVGVTVVGNVQTNGRLVFEKSYIWIAVTILVFLAAAYFFYRENTKAIIFDKSGGYFWKGKQDKQGEAFNPADQKESVKLSEIHALQIIFEWVRGGGKNKRPYKSYELNLILNSGERMNVIDHGNRKALLLDANMLAQFLNVPLWDRTELKPQPPVLH